MTINAVSGGSSAWSVQSLAALTGTTPTSASAATKKADGDGDDTTSVSGPAALLGKLKSLQQSDPAKFKQVMSKISDTLKADASSSTDPKQQKMLTDLAAKFDAAGKSGDLSGLVPPKGAQGAHGAHKHHGGGGEGGPPPAAAASSSGSATQPADTNGDGIVSGAEQQAYDAAQAAKQGSAASGAASGAAAGAYLKGAGSDEHAKMTATMSQVMGIVDSAMSG